MNAVEANFHTGIDQNVRAYQIYQQGLGWGYNPVTILTTYNVSLSYQFYPHLHPYVLQLARTLSQTDSVFDMLGMSVLYATNPDGSIQAIDDTTRALLAGLPGGAQLLDGAGNPAVAGAPLSILNGAAASLQVQIASGTGFVNADGSAGTLAAGLATTLSLPIPIPNSPTTGFQAKLTDGTLVIFPAETSVTLPAGGTAYLSDGTQVTLPAQTQVLLRTGLPKPQQTPVKLYDPIFTAQQYKPGPAVRRPYPVKDLDFSVSGAYSIYNWELFFHAPLMIAIQLSQNQQFQDAQNWFHTIFDPTDDSNGPTPARFWKIRPFQYTDVELIQQVMLNLATGQDPQLQKDTINSINAWMETPFQPFVVAQYRPTAYMLKTVMAYLDNLIAWGDSLFRQYTIETINEATQIYVLAANILGPKPQVVPVKESTAPQTYASIRPNLDQFSNALVDMEVDIPFDVGPAPAPASDPTGPNTLGSIGQTQFFCIPQNDMLLGYWDTVADRLFKIHNSLNIQGVFQKLPLFDPPIDPALLVRAAAEGLDVNAIVNGLNQPLPLVRFQLLVAKAADICQEVKSLGSNLLSAFEKGDNEALSLLRAQHETIVLNLAEMVKYSQWQDAIKARQALEQSLANAGQRYTYYQKLLGRTAAQITIPTLDPIDASGLASLNFSQSDASGEPEMAFDPINVDISQNSASVSDGEIKTLSSHEAQELADLASSQSNIEQAAILEQIGSTLSMLPNFEANLLPMGCGATLAFGSPQLSAMMNFMASGMRSQAQIDSYEANVAGRLGSYSRREMDWAFQSNLAVGEINQVVKQLRGAQVREAIAQKEYQNHQTQMAQAQDIQNYLQGTELPVGNQGQHQKTSTVGFYLWMKGALQNLYSNAFQLAFATAKKAEQALQHELGDPTLTYVQSNYMDGMEGLLAGEKMLYDVRRMEMDYHDLNVREYEMTKQVSLLQVSPLALIQLRATGTCLVGLPEELFDLDGPGHFFRRIKSVAVTIPCVSGPYTGVNCTLSLQNSSIRTSSRIQGSGYSDQKNYSAFYGTIQAVVTSTAQMDSGLFEANLHDERYLPFEYSGVISQWQLTLPSDVPQFDLDTITDVILHIRYTAREGGSSLKPGAIANLKAKIGGGATVGSVRLFSMRHEFPTEWAKFKAAAANAPAPLSFTLWPQHFPFWAGKVVSALTVKGVEFFAEMTAPTATAVNLSATAAGLTVPANRDALNPNPNLNHLMTGTLGNVALPSVADPTKPPPAPYTLFCDNNAMNDLWMAVTWPAKP
ncbi:MAG TPA: hypothetical protein VGF85_10275 [Opitutaceae bacterium]